MSLLDLLFPHRRREVIITDDQVVVIQGHEVIIKERHPHPHSLKMSMSSVSLFDQANPSFIITKIQGEIMANTFKKTQGVNFQLAFTKADGSAGDADLSTIKGSANDPSIVSVNFDPTDQTKGTILGIADGASNVNFTALSKVGQAPLSVSVLITVADAVVLPDTSGDATAIGVTLSDAFNQDGTPVV
jgi:hypothetical protein